MLAINLPDSLATKLKEASQCHGKAAADMAAEALEYWLEVDEWAACRASRHEPNEATAMAIEESLSGEGKTVYTSTADLFAELEREC